MTLSIETPEGRFRLRRSVLIAPGDNDRLLQRMATCDADVCIVEWEDGVRPHRKELARQTTADALRAEWRCPERVIRVNQSDSPYFEADVIAAVAAGVDGIMLPKIESAAAVEEAARLIAHAEGIAARPLGSVEIWAMIETVHAVLALEQIAQATRMTAMLFGGGDLGADLRLKRVQLGADRTLGLMRYEYIYAMGRFVAAARAAGIDPINVGYTSFKDLEGTRKDAEISAQFGFTGALAISPRQVDVLNEVFSPAEDDVRWSNEVLDAVGDAERDPAVAVVDGGMVDGPFVRVARTVRTLNELVEMRAARSA